MKASELVESLQALIAIYGDVAVRVPAAGSDSAEFLGPIQQVTAMHGIRYLADDQADDRYGTHDAVYPGEDLPDDSRLEAVILITPHTKE